MGECDFVGCEGDDKISYTCNECGLTFCSEHRLPENHRCSALRKTESDSDPVFSTGLQNKVGKKRGLTHRSDRVIRDDSNTEDDISESESSDETADHSERSNRREMPGKTGSDDSAWDPISGWSSDSNNINHRQHPGNSQSSKSPAPKPLAERSSTIPSDGGFSFRWATWLYRLVVILVVAFVLSILIVGFTPASVPDGVPSVISDPIEEAGGISSAFIANLTDGVSTSDSQSVASNSSQVDGSPETTVDEGGELSSLNSEQIEQLVHEKINEKRESRGLSLLSYDTDLAEIARYHSEDMAQNGYFAHTSPGGEEMEDRYDMFNYNCRVNVGANQYASGGENIFKQSFTGFQFTNEELATAIVEGWMNSMGHRENILKEYWDKEGIGVYILEDESGATVYVTQNFC